MSKSAVFGLILLIVNAMWTFLNLTNTVLLEQQQKTLTETAAFITASPSMKFYNSTGGSGGRGKEIEKGDDYATYDTSTGEIIMHY